MRLLWVKTELLHPLDKGGRIRTYAMLRELNRDLQISYLALDDGLSSPEARGRASEYCTSVECVPARIVSKGSIAFVGDLARNTFSALPYAVWKYRSATMRRRIEQIARSGAVDAVVCDFLAPAVNVPDYLPVPTVLFQHNVESAIWERHAKHATDPLRRRYFQSQWRRMLAFERAQCSRFDHVVAVSPDDASRFRTQLGARSVSEVGTGVDTDYFQPSASAEPEPGNITFTGSMDWMPNGDAMAFFVDGILPLVRANMPQVRLRIVGRRPSPNVQALAQRDSAIEVTGTVPDVRPHLERAAVVVVPLRIGGGTRLKIFEAMAMQKAVVSTSVGAEGLPVRHEEHLLIADTPADFASAVNRLLREPALARELGERAARFVRSRFGWSAVAAEFAETCRQVMSVRQHSVPQLVHHT